MADIKLNEHIKIISEEPIGHSKATEVYIEVEFPFDDKTWNLFIPIVYRRNGLFLEYPGKDNIDLDENKAVREKLYGYLNKVAEAIPKTSDELNNWIKENRKWWRNTHNSAAKTEKFYMGLLKNTGKWMCCTCLSPRNPNPTRRIQQLKDFGYTLATDTNRYCSKCKENRTHLMMIPIERYGVGNGYEQWSDFLRKRIIRVLGGIDVCDNKRNSQLLPDHKFPEIRWDKETIGHNPDDMSEEAIRAKFQLMTNQHNEEKREACRKCRLTGKRPYPFGIKYYYEGNEDWEGEQQGKKAENGCKGCCWYDFEKWRKQLNEDLLKINN